MESRGRLIGVAMLIASLVGIRAGRADEPLAAVYDADGDSYALDDSRLPLVSSLKEDMKNLQEKIDLLRGIACAYDEDGEGRPEWLTAQIGFLGHEIDQVERRARNLGIGAENSLWNRIRESRSAVARVMAISKRSPSATQKMPDATGGSIEGTITASITAQPLSSMKVSCFALKGVNLAFVKATRTASDGTYKLGNLANGKYWVLATDSSKNPIYASELYGDFPFWYGKSSTPVTVRTGQPTTGIDFGLDLGGRIQGTVIAADTKAPLENVGVYLLMPIGDRLGFAIGMVTDAQGRFDTFRIAGPLSPLATYRLWFSAPEGYVDEGYDNLIGVHNFKKLTPITIGPGEVKNLSIDLTHDSQTVYISGHVTDRRTGLPVQGVPMTVYDVIHMVVELDQYTDGSGFYRAGPYWAGTYAVLAAPAPSTGYAVQEYDNRGFWADFTLIPGIPSQEAGGIDFHLDKFAGITGKVFDKQTKAPLRNVAVTILYHPVPSNAPPFPVFLNTDPKGVYGWSLLNPLDEQRVHTRNARGQGYIDQIYKNIPCPTGGCDPNNPNWDWTVGTKITLAGGAMKGNIDFALSKQQ